MNNKNKTRCKKIVALLVCAVMMMAFSATALAASGSTPAGTYGTLKGGSSMTKNSHDKYLGLSTQVTIKAPDYIGYSWALTVADAGTPINGTEQVTSRGVLLTGEQVELHHYKNPVTGTYDHFATTFVTAYCNHFCYGSYGSYVVYTSEIRK